jgi:hypothetical protein
MKITAVAAVLAAALAVGLAACGPKAAKPATAATAHSAAPAGTAATQKAAAQASVKASVAATMTPTQAAAMNKWYSGVTVIQAANVCGDVYRVYFDNVAVNSGSGSSSLQGDITRLQADVVAAEGNPPPVAADAVIWKRVLNAYSNAAGGPTNSGLVAAVRSAEHAPWRWTPSFGGTLLVCLNVRI